MYNDLIKVKYWNYELIIAVCQKTINVSISTNYPQSKTVNHFCILIVLIKNSVTFLTRHKLFNVTASTKRFAVDVEACEIGS